MWVEQKKIDTVLVYIEDGLAIKTFFFGKTLSETSTF